MAMHPVRDAIASHGWLLYAMALGLCCAGIMPFPILIGGAAVWLIMFGGGTCDPATHGVARSASQVEVLVVTAVACAFVSYASILWMPILSETARIVMDALMDPLRKWSCSTQGREPNIFPPMFVSQFIGGCVSPVPLAILSLATAWYASKKRLSNASFSDADKVKMCLAIGVTSYFIAGLPPLPTYRGGAYGSRLDQPRVGWMQFGRMRELDLA